VGKKAMIFFWNFFEILSGYWLGQIKSGLDSRKKGGKGAWFILVSILELIMFGLLISIICL
jgi:hypothetical protein